MLAFPVILSLPSKCKNPFPKGSYGLPRTCGTRNDRLFLGVTSNKKRGRATNGTGPSFLGSAGMYSEIFTVRRSRSC